MAEAWNAAPLTSDTDMNLKVAYPHPDFDAERAKVIAAMRRHLRPGARSSARYDAGNGKARLARRRHGPGRQGVLRG